MATEVDKSNKKGKEGKRKTIILAVVAIVIIGILAGIIVYLLTKEQKGDVDATKEAKRNVVVTPDNVDEVLADMQNAEVVPPGYYTVTMNYEWRFPTGDAVSENAYVENSVTNTNDVYFDLFLKEDVEHPIYESPVIPRGGSLGQIALDENLKAGTYECVLVYHMVDEDQNTVDTLRVALTVIVME